MTTYKCTSCGASDSDRTSNPPLNLICYNCRSGFGLTVQQASQSKNGMFPVNETGYYPWGEKAPVSDTAR